MHNALTYRHATIGDIEQLRTLALAAYGQFAATLGTAHWATMQGNISSQEKIIELLSKATCFVCTCQDELIGMAYLLPSGNPTPIFQANWSYLRMVGVHPAHSGQGIAKALTKLCIDHATSTGEKTIALHTSEFMDAARHIYEGLGFTILKEIEPIFGKRYWLYTLDINRHH